MYIIRISASLCLSSFLGNNQLSELEVAPEKYAHEKGTSMVSPDCILEIFNQQKQINRIF